MNIMKICPKCQINKEEIEFYKNCSQKDGLSQWGKVCTRNFNRSKQRKQKISEYHKTEKYKIIRRKYHKEYNKKYCKTEKYKIYLNNYRKSDKWRENRRIKRQTDINFKIKQNLRKRLWDAIKENSKSASTLNLLGCSIEFLKKYLEGQFTEGMIWDNYGKWHIDHIRPCASFDLSKEEEQKKCFHWTNLQPLWAKENASKGAKYEYQSAGK